jgi:hypothetical protein
VYILNISDVNIESKIFEILGIQLSADIIFTVYSLYTGRKERDSVVFKYINISDIWDMNIEKIFQILVLRNIYKLMTLCITGAQLSARILSARYYLGRVFIIHWLYKVLHHRIDGYTQYKERKIASDNKA